MSWRVGIFSLVALLGSASLVTATKVQVYFWSEGHLAGVERVVSDEGVLVEATLSALAAGPNEQELAAGITSALPPGTTVNSVSLDDGKLNVDFSPDLVVGGVDDMWIEAVFRQVRWTMEPFDIAGINLTVAGAPLPDYLPPLPPVKPAPPDKVGVDQQAPIITTGTSLSGRSIALSPGHGMRWNGSGWYYERPVYCAPLNNEDLHNVELVDYLNIYLLQDGAVTKPYRCLDKSYGDYSPGRPFWTMSASYWLKNIGYPCSIYASSTGNCALDTSTSHATDSLYSRPRASNYDDTTIYVSMHTNGYQGDCTGSGCPNGTCTYYDNGTTHAAWGPISRTLAQNVNTAIVNTIHTDYGDSTWRDRGALDSNGGFAEIRLPTRAAILIELAFHDTCDRDGLYLQDEWFRSATMWATYKGICDYFGTSPTYAFYSAEYVSDTIPTEMMPGQTYDVSVTFRNRGVLWTNTRDFHLGAVGDSDPFTAFNRVNLTANVGTTQTHTFEFTMTAPLTPGVHTTDWRMVRDGVTWFGPTLVKQIDVGREFARGDFNYDGDVDMEDFGHLQACYSGVGIIVTDPTCLNASLDGDSDVDPSDFQIFQACFTGPDRQADPYCGY